MQHFKRLNLECLDKYNLTESHDLMVLNNPKGTLLGWGGFIWLAKAGDEIIGSVGSMNEGHGIFELIKMCVLKRLAGKGDQ